MQSQPKLIEFADPKQQAGIETVAAILQTKGRDVWSIAPDATVYEAIALMAEKHCGSLVVLVNHELVGMISERDYARKVILQGKSSKHTPVGEVMSSPVLTVTPRDTVHGCLHLVTRHRIRHLPVLEQGRVVGLVSIGDLVNSILSMQAHTIDQLETYITSNYPK